MNERKQPKGPQHPVEEGESIKNPLTPEENPRYFESGSNRDMQVQRSNRQGGGNPTQQGRDDR